MQINNTAPIDKIRMKKISFPNAEINKIDNFFDYWLTLKTNYHLLQIFHFTYFVLVNEAKENMWIPHFSPKGVVA